MELDELVDRREIIICCGSGGVGKTTTAAAIAMHAAIKGRKTIVLTIDPAKRLANSLGLPELGNEERKIPPHKFVEAGIRPKGELYAMMLDTKRTFDDLIARFSLNPDMREKILSNPLYRSISDTFVGSQEYMAMEKLYEIYSEGDYDLIVLDTPPTKHALDFLDAPRRLTDFLDGRILKWFLKPYFSAGRAGIRLFQRGTSVILRTLERVTGITALKIVSDFFIAFEGLYDGFKERAEAVYDLLHDRVTAFVLVTSPEDLTIEEAIYFHDKLIEYEMPFCGLIINKVHNDFSAENVKEADVRRLARRVVAALARNEDERKAMQTVAEDLAENLQNFRNLAAIDQENIRSLTDSIDSQASVRIVPFFDTDVYDIQGLLLINEYLFGPDGKK
ncbi:MAG: ArsA family ATPase [Candidatus Abyssobacteria bacterium SURF_5]|uniref:arsenite-transporting ATPase n=1 Tax=Abyssobacteria bacterium (strain SURF_5) TaxID=2093360 RepID=A0A3A4NW91_ABYX5|nr:MAG: ArsA family ATPase [Candidatus Abyssubacteria bacterium SURF_5]